MHASSSFARHGGHECDLHRLQCRLECYNMIYSSPFAAIVSSSCQSGLTPADILPNKASAGDGGSGSSEVRYWAARRCRGLDGGTLQRLYGHRARWAVNRRDLGSVRREGERRREEKRGEEGRVRKAIKDKENKNWRNERKLGRIRRASTEDGGSATPWMQAAEEEESKVVEEEEVKTLLFLKHFTCAQLWSDFV